MTRAYDYIIVGGGSAGCVLANRLTEDRGVSVLMLEAGGWDRDPWIHIPMAWPRILTRRMHDWMYFAEPEASCEGRSIECARGRVIGGSSSINAMAYVRGHHDDYARWAANGLPDWSFAHVLPYFRRGEHWEGGADEFRGGDGPLTTQMNRYADPLNDAFLAAARAAGHPFTDDYNGAQQEGFARMQMTVRNGRRCSAADAYLRPALRRANLGVSVRSLARRVLFEGSRAVGVEFDQGGRLRTVRARREVILAGGVINSPQLLMLSGVGAADALRPLGIAPVADLPGVGANLQDHISAGVLYKRRTPGPMVAKMRYDRIAVELAKTYWFGKGITNDLPGGLVAYLRSDAAQAMPDVQVLFAMAPMTAGPHLAPLVPPYADGFGARAVVLRPQTRGRVELASADPAQAPRIRQNFFASDQDIRTLRAGLRMVRDVGRQPAMQPYVAAELAPGADDSDEALDAYIRTTAITVHHPLGTCRMGAAGDPMAVVDSELRVFGLAGLRVVDASVMPDLVGGNINAPVMMIAEKASDLIRGRPTLPPAPVYSQPRPGVHPGSALSHMAPRP